MNTRQMSLIIQDLEKLFENKNNFSELKNSSVFLTGAAGFVGQWLLLSFHYLNKQFGYNINVVATSKNFPDSYVFRYLKSDDNISFENINVQSLFDIPKNVNYIIHLAATPDRRVHASSPIDVMHTIVNGTENLLQAATRVDNLSKVILFSSGQAGGLMKFKDNQVDYLAPECLSFSATYVESKRLSETIAHVYGSQFQLPIGIVRPYSFIGPLQNLERPWAANNFIKDAIHKNKISVLGNPKTTKSFMYPTDMVFSILEFLISNDDHRILNLGSTESVSLGIVAETVSKYHSERAAIEYSDPDELTARHDFYPVICGNAEDPCESFDSAIYKTMKWFEVK
jgi:dTDP-glucose 4,6-dehydratase